MSDALRDAVIRGSTIAPQWDEATYQALHLLDRLESQNQALQERIAKGKGALTLAVDLMIEAEGHEDYTKAVQAIEYAQSALSPTQETEGNGS